MNDAIELSIGFLRSHPEGAGPVLAALAPADAAAFLEQVPDALAANALQFMQPLVAAAILPALTRKTAAAVLLKMDTYGRSRIMRSLDDGLMATIVDVMPKGAARDLARVLNYPAGSAGAWMSSDVAAFEKTTTVCDCLMHLRALPASVGNSVFVIDARKKLSGAVDLAKLLAAPDDTTLEAAVEPGIKRISPYARLSSLVALTAWDTALSLPVVDTKGRLLGALRFDRLREGLAAEQRAEPEKHMGQIMVHMAEAFLVCAAGMLHGPSPKLALSRPVGEVED